MKCLILAAGYATRLYPLTENFPKPLLKVKDNTIIDWLIDDVENTNMVNEYIVVSNHKYVSHFEEWKKTRSEKITIIDDGTTSNETRLGAVADINLAVENLNIDDDLLIMAGDNVLDFSLENFTNYYKSIKRTCMMTYYEQDLNRIKKGSNLVMDNTYKLVEMNEKPENPNSNYCGTPFYIYSREDVHKIKDAISDGCKIDAPGSLISYLCQKTDIYGYIMPGSRYDIGDIESYKHVNDIYNGITIK